ncbi:carbohydrate kinase family protein [Polaribacter sargassicola]|uniref:carbohydrate kinase family protein n=1 Tax=Polaribacter sargassicola TaxID=2836891 RepID=UPI001F482394|nr:PfkB family carbohydrate kinase [Polaribacter sp. DS7-9]MCG1035588.1 carbohydrate kinase [Polaribacter sp. DS7-9]
MSTIVCFGEVLWDVFPNHKKIGGAPLNVASRLQSFANNVAMISAIGNDDLGKQILEYLKTRKIDIKNVQVLDDFNTGKVTVTLNNKGAASYCIEHPKAWDKIKFTEQASAVVKSADAFVFGSLICRDAVSKTTLYSYLEIANYKIFDVNLRAPFFDKETLIELMHTANFIKFNDEELYEIAKYLGSKFNNLEQNLWFVSEKTSTKHICVTKGEHGAVLLYNSTLFYNSGYQIKVADTVGAGDSFLATLINYLLEKQNPQRSLDIACAVGALVAQKEGANPIITEKEILDFSGL